MESLQEELLCLAHVVADIIDVAHQPHREIVIISSLIFTNLLLQILSNLHRLQYLIVAQRKEALIVSEFIVEVHIPLFLQIRLIILGITIEFCGTARRKQTTEFIKTLLVLASQVGYGPVGESNIHAHHP